ncbi:MAG: type II secretion system secretin GspD [Nitrospiria bacterium]
MIYTNQGVPLKSRIPLAGCFGLLLLIMSACATATSKVPESRASVPMGTKTVSPDEDVSATLRNAPDLGDGVEDAAKTNTMPVAPPKKNTLAVPEPKQETHPARQAEAALKKEPQASDPHQMMSAPPETGKQTPRKNVVLNFDNADIYEVISTIARNLEINYIIDPAVKGTVNIHTRGEISERDLFDIFFSILKTNGAAAMKEGALYHIVPTHSVKTRLLIPQTGQSEPEAGAGGNVALQIIPLQFISATEAANVLKSFISPGAELTVYEKNNILLVTDFSENIDKLLGIIDLLDVNVFEKTRLKLYPMQEAEAQEVAKEMRKIFAALALSSASGKGVGIHFIPIIRINALLVITSLPQALPEVEKWLLELDKAVTAGGVRTFIYHVKNGIANELADILNAVFSSKKRETTAPRKVSQTPVKKEAPPEKSVAKNTSPNTPPPDALGGEIKVIPYATTNTIIIKATQQGHRHVLEILKELDIVPRQVLIDIMIAEVTLSDENALGVEFVQRGSGGGRSSLVGSSLGLSQAGVLASGGITSSIIGGDFQSVLNALASKNRVSVLASPHIIASDGKEASIDIGDEVPLVASKIFIDQREEITVERRNTGVILKVNPHINTTGLVTLDISLELSDASKSAIEGESDIRIFKRNAKTNMVVQDGQTIVVGGLIDEKKEKVVNKVPFLGDIPILGFLFRNTKESTKKTELILVITPHVIRTLNEANDVTQEFMQKLKGLKKELDTKDL